MKKICVIGAVNMDTFLEVEEAPKDGETVVANRSSKAYGGKGSNAAIAMKKLNADTQFFGCVGDDADGEELIQNLKSMDIDVSNMKIKKDVTTGAAYIILDKNNENRIIAAPGANQSITREDIRENCYDMIKESDLVFIQLEISREGILEILKICKELDKKLILDAGPAHGWTSEDFEGVYIVSPNETELAQLTGNKISTADDVIVGARKLLDAGVQNVLVKLGDKGSIFVNHDTVIKQKSYQVNAVDPTGAGDSYTSGFAKGLMEGLSIAESMKLGSKCGAVTVTRLGASNSLPTQKDIDNFEDFLVSQ